MPSEWPGPAGDRDDTTPAASDSLSREIAALHARTLRPPGRWHRVTVRSVAVVVVVAGLAGVAAVLALGSHHYDTSVRNPKFCSSVAAINDLIGTRLSTVSVLHEGDLLSCSYDQGSGGSQALSVDVDEPNSGVGANTPGGFGTDNPCLGRRPITVAGLSGCDMSGAAGTSPGRPSVLVKDGEFDCQFTSYVAAISMEQLEKLATTFLTGPTNEV